MWIESYTNEKDHVRHVYEEIRFVDSYKFTNSLLDELAWNLTLENFTYLNFHYMSRPVEDLALIRPMGYFPYSFVDSYARYEPDGLPPRENGLTHHTGGWCYSK